MMRSMPNANSRIERPASTDSFSPLRTAVKLPLQHERSSTAATTSTTCTRRWRRPWWFVTSARSPGADGIGTLPRTDAPRDSEQARLRKDLCVRRRQVYAHTDAQSGRSGDAIVGESGGISGRAISTHAFTYPRDQLQAVVDLCEQQAAKFEQDAFAIQSEMNERNRDSPS